MDSSTLPEFYSKWRQTVWATEGNTLQTVHLGCSRCGSWWCWCTCPGQSDSGTRPLDSHTCTWPGSGPAGTCTCPWWSRWTWATRRSPPPSPTWRSSPTWTCSTASLRGRSARWWWWSPTTGLRHPPPRSCRPSHLQVGNSDDTAIKLFDPQEQL